MNEIEIYSDDFLFSDMNFMTGMGSVFNIPGNYYQFNWSDSDEEADEKAIRSDWKAVGNYIREATNQYNKNNESKK